MPTRRQVANTRRAISPRWATRRRRITAYLSRSEDTDVLGALHGRAVHGGKAEAQHGTGVAGVDDAVVRELAALVGLLSRPLHRPAEEESRFVRTAVDAAHLPGRGGADHQRQVRDRRLRHGVHQGSAVPYVGRLPILDR